MLEILRPDERAIVEAVFGLAGPPETLQGDR